MNQVDIEWAKKNMGLDVSDLSDVPLKKKSNPQDLYNMFRALGVSDVHAKGALANIKGESDFDPEAVGDSGTSIGLFQHHGPRKEALQKQYPDSWNDPKNQIQYLLSEPDTKNYLSQSFNTPEEASEYFTRNIERPKNADIEARRRAAYASNIVDDNMDWYVDWLEKTAPKTEPVVKEDSSRGLFNKLNQEINKFAPDTSETLEDKVQGIGPTENILQAAPLQGVFSDPLKEYLNPQKEQILNEIRTLEAQGDYRSKHKARKLKEQLVLSDLGETAPGKFAKGAGIKGTEMAEGLVTPENFLYAVGSALNPLVAAGVTAKFLPEMAMGAYEEGKKIPEAIRNKDWEALGGDVMGFGANVGMARGMGKHLGKTVKGLIEPEIAMPEFSSADVTPEAFRQPIEINAQKVSESLGLEPDSVLTKAITEKEIAEGNAKLRQAEYAAQEAEKLAERTKFYSSEALEERASIPFERRGIPQQAPDAGIFSNEPAIVDAQKTSKEFNPEIHSLSDWVIKKGGVLKDSGLEKLSTKEGGYKGLVTKQGTPLDLLRESANEEGFGPYETVNDFRRDLENDVVAKRRMLEKRVYSNLKQYTDFGQDSKYAGLTKAELENPPVTMRTGEMNLMVGDKIRVPGDTLKVIEKNKDGIVLKDGIEMVVDPKIDTLDVIGGEKGIKRNPMKEVPYPQQFSVKVDVPKVAKTKFKTLYKELPKEEILTKSKEFKNLKEAPVDDLLKEAFSDIVEDLKSERGSLSIKKTELSRAQAAREELLRRAKEYASKNLSTVEKALGKMGLNEDQIKVLTKKKDEIKEPSKEPIIIESSKAPSRVYQRLKEEHPEILRENLTYEKSHHKEQIDKAIEIGKNDPERLVRIALGIEESGDLLQSAASIAIAEKALQKGDSATFEEMTRTRSHKQTRRGQEISMENASISDNSVTKYTKQLLHDKLESLGKSFVEEVKQAFGPKSVRKSRAKRGLEKLDSEVEKAKKFVEKRKMNISKAQEFLDSITCK